MCRLLGDELADTQLVLLLGPHVHFDDDTPNEFLGLQEYKDELALIAFRTDIHSRHRQLGCALPKLCYVIRPKTDDRIFAFITSLQTIAKNLSSAELFLLPPQSSALRSSQPAMNDTTARSMTGARTKLRYITCLNGERLIRRQHPNAVESHNQDIGSVTGSAGLDR